MTMILSPRWLPIVALALALVTPLLASDGGGSDGDAAPANCAGCTATGGGTAQWTPVPNVGVQVNVLLKDGICRFVDEVNDCLEKKCKIEGSISYWGLPQQSTLSAGTSSVLIGPGWGNAALPGFEVACDDEKNYIVSWGGNISSFALACSKCKRT